MSSEDKGGLSWLGGDTGWWGISREERYFCAELYRVLRGKEVKFVEFLNENYGKTLRTNSNWELAYEVCFYRDWTFDPDRKRRGELSMKRTFDLVLFSDAQIVIFEAKAQQSYDTAQLKHLRKDKEDVVKCIREKSGVNAPEILTAGIKSGEYKPVQATLAYFDLCPPIDWCKLAEWCTWDDDARRVFERADAVYRH